MNKHINLLHNLENSEEAKIKKNEYFNDTVKYQRKYGFQMGTGQHATWNNEADAFKHAYWQANEYVFENNYKSLFEGILHEMSNPKQPKGELNMDLWNNQVGQEIGAEVKDAISNSQYKPTKSEIKDYIAQKVMQRMRAGDLITNPNDPRKFSDYHKIKARKDELVPKYNANRNDFNNPASLLKYKRGYYKGFINDENGKDIIYTVENIGAMSDEEYNNNKKVLNAQIKKIGLPSNHDLRRPSSNGDVYVHSYTKSDGTHVTSHYRSRPN